MDRWWVRVQERCEVEYGRQIGWGEPGLVFLLCRSEWRPARVRVCGSVFRRLVVLSARFLEFSARSVGDHPSTNTSKQEFGT